MDVFGNVWASSDDGIFCIKKDKVVTHEDKFNDFKKDLFRLSINSSGKIWALGEGYLCSFDGENVEYFTSDSILIQGGNSGLLALDDGSVLFGGSGLKILYPDNVNQPFRVLDDKGWVNGINYTKEKNIIYSSGGRGLVVLEDFKKIKTYTDDDDSGFLFDVTTTVFVDKKGWIWSGHESGGVGFFDGNIWGYLNTDDGLHDNNIWTIVENKGDDYYFISDEGYTKYTPNKNAGVVTIREIGTSKKNFNPKDNPVIESIVNERIRINFSSLNHTNKNKTNRYNIEVSGQDFDYKKIINKGSFEWYPNSSGEYQFSVQSIDRDLNFSDKESVLLKIVNPWYAKASFLVPFLEFLVYFHFCLFHHIRNFKSKRNLVKN